jgi:hypothetical protein
MLTEGLSIDTTFNPHKFLSDSTFKLQLIVNMARPFQMISYHIPINSTYS